MPQYFIQHTLSSTTRIDVRNEIVDLFKQEVPGTGKGINASKYDYTVETFNNYSIVLKRPATLNKGFDFVVHVITPRQNQKIFKSNSGIRNLSYPSHQSIIDALLQIKNSNVSYYTSVIATHLHALFNTNTLVTANSLTGSFIDHSGNNHPVEIILLAVKWLFIEQDITYWNWSGRNMFWNMLVTNQLI